MTMRIKSTFRRKYWYYNTPRHVPTLSVTCLYDKDCCKRIYDLKRWPKFDMTMTNNLLAFARTCLLALGMYYHVCGHFAHSTDAISLQPQLQHPTINWSALD